MNNFEHKIQWLPTNFSPRFGSEPNFGITTRVKGSCLRHFQPLDSISNGLDQFNVAPWTALPLHNSF